MTKSHAGLARTEDLALLTGSAAFVDDLHLPGMVEAAFVRSQVAHARIVDVVMPTSEINADMLLGVTAADLDLARHLPVANAHPGLRAAVGPAVLAHDVVRYIGEPIAMVVAENRYLAEDLAELVDVDLALLEVSANLDVARHAGAALVHESAPGNIAGSHIQAVGDARAALETAPCRVRRTLRIDRGSAQPMETRGVVADWDGSKLTVWSGTQRPHGLRRMLAQYLALDVDRIHVVSPSTGGSFGCKAYFTNEELLVSWASIRLSRPVKWIEDRTEHFLATYPEHLQIAEVECGFNQDGTITALLAHVSHDLGAYAPYGFAVAQNTMNHLVGPYRIPAVEASFEGFYTNKTPAATYRGAGRPQGVFIIERMMDLAARRLGVDPAEIRRRNLIGRDEMPYDTGLSTPLGQLRYDSGDFSACLETALTTVGYAELRSSPGSGDGRYRRGIGIANYVECSVTRPSETAAIRVNCDGTCTITVGTSAQGQGHETMLARVVAAALGIERDRIRVRNGDSQHAESVGTFGSRVAIMAGSAAHLAAQALRLRCVETAARLLQTAPANLQFSGGVIRHVDNPAVTASLADLAIAHEADGAVLEVTETFASEDLHVSSGTHVAVVDVDLDLLEVSFVKYAIAHDCGVVIDDLIVEGQTIGAFAQGIGGCLLEQMDYDEDGQLLTGSFAGYLLPTAHDVPTPMVSHIVSPSPMNPLGVKGAGEGGMLPVAAAIAAAIEDALGMDVDSMPLPPRALDDLIEALA
jgi:aerobic carbon-monoxide dehydrogenase large subunit